MKYVLNALSLKSNTSDAFMWSVLKGNVSYACCEYPIQPGPFLSSGNIHPFFIAYGYNCDPGYAIPE